LHWSVHVEHQGFLSDWVKQWIPVKMKCCKITHLGWLHFLFSVGWYNEYQLLGWVVMNGVDQTMDHSGEDLGACFTDIVLRLWDSRGDSGESWPLPWWH